VNTCNSTITDSCFDEKERNVTVSCPATLLLRSRDAARMLAVSERTLWGLTAPRGPIPCVRIGGAIRYRVIDLEAFVAKAAQSSGQAETEPEPSPPLTARQETKREVRH
jgi:hypothetical protein